MRMSYAATIALLLTAPLPTAEQTQSNPPGIAVPPGPVSPPNGFPPYADGTPCIGTPKDPTSFPDKKSNPCDGRPLTLTRPGPELLPIGYPPYPDGTPCIGQPRDVTRFPAPEGPNQPNPNPCSGNPDGKPVKVKDSHAQPVRDELLLPDSKGDFETVVDPPYTQRGEFARKRTVHRPTGRTVMLEVSYRDGQVVTFMYRFHDGSLELKLEALPHPAKRGYYLARRTTYAHDGVTVVKVEEFGPDGKPRP